jgi:ABC-type multidrug transport system fused ATPase/permease subunit
MRRLADVAQGRTWFSMAGVMLSAMLASVSEQNDPQRPVIPRLYDLVRPYSRTVLGGLLCLIVAVAAELYPPIIWKHVIDDGLPTKNWTFIAWQIALLALTFAVGSIFNALRGALLERAGQALTLDLRLRLFEKLQGQSAAYFSSSRSGDLISRLTADVEAVQEVLVNGTDAVIGNLLRLVGVAGIFIALQPALGVLTVLPMIAVGLMLVRYNAKVRPVYRAARNRLGNLAARFSDSLGGIRVIQAFAREASERLALEALGRLVFNEQIKAIGVRNRAFPIIRFVANFGNIIMLGGGAWFIAQGQFTLGGLLAYRGYGRYFFGPVDDLVVINDLVQKAEASGRRIFEVLDAPVSVTQLETAVPLPSPLRGEIRFENVSFRYSDAQPAVLEGLDLTVKAGERVAILGASGVGKSTLLALVTRQYDPTNGRVLIDGVDLRAVQLHSLRSQVAQVPQESYLFHASVLENLRFARPSATQAEVESAARGANALDFIEALPQRWDTVVGERGVRLSGGQRQRIAVARALLTDPQILVLDEPTSAVDPESEILILEGLERLMHGRTALIVSHRLSLAQSADRVIVLEGGRVAEQGSPQELRLSGGRFAKMLEVDTVPV